MGKPIDSSSGAAAANKPRQIFYAVTSFCLGAWAFYKVNAISGPAFEPILAVCNDPSISTDDFAEKTGYHSYEPMLGLGVFKVLVCLITQFLLELRETYPAGLLTWGGVVVVALPLTLSNTISAGRKGAKGPVIYPTVIGLLAQLFGISVIFPLIYNPSYIFSGSKLGVPTTNLRTIAGTIFALPITILTYLVFSAPTESYLWTLSAGIMGGPILAMMALSLWTDKSSSMEATPQNIIKSSKAIQKAYSLLAIVGFVFWSCLVAVSFRSYGFAIDNLWRDIWVEAGPSVAFMTIDTGVLYISALLFIAYQSEWKAIKALSMTPLVGPATACCLALMELESEAANALLVGVKKDI
mmetsp:Transcript_31906/g.67080  ORF Transcript_31906/g.67080 Transcript_31906/m.67080 type:complete len:354 (-) Transcript_31906:286-1347(-)|eukprot:CAMPEP_0172310632 /NCGR_PEP_ID=MMETSP1058-20130122/12175_1 /TAXON_ID=83371 /ORGANISM="Detonula confervacea, Strain CCMP 353" /LENGTH=353 /DNA_ID=CAMNT_0013023521 /DNA_START=45 /DNA_END=1106 /DNA_ORIENTATION=-